LVEAPPGALAPGLLRGKAAWITGGGTGLGQAMALRFAALGARVGLTGRRRPPLEATAETIRAGGGTAAVAPADVREPAAVDAALETLERELGGIDILVNNAAGNFLCPSESLSPNGFAAVVGIVLHGTFHCTAAAGRRWIATGRGGTVLSIVTTYAETGSAYVLPSACGKAGVVALTRSLAVEWARHGIRLNAIAPGPIPTEGAFSRLLPTDAMVRGRIARIPAGRLGTPAELAELAAFLVSDAADWIRGEVVTLDGGEWLRGAGQFNDLLDLPADAFAALQGRGGRVRRRRPTTETKEPERT
jgi:NAD(P)-dependent dehydrogenase (short-subunit alcohol dehydrogenase family)